jgi:hypothetical protein
MELAPARIQIHSISGPCGGRRGLARIALSGTRPPRVNESFIFVLGCGRLGGRACTCAEDDENLDARIQCVERERLLAAERALRDAIGALCVELTASIDYNHYTPAKLRLAITPDVVVIARARAARFARRCVGCVVDRDSAIRAFSALNSRAAFFGPPRYLAWKDDLRAHIAEFPAEQPILCVSGCDPEREPPMGIVEIRGGPLEHWRALLAAVRNPADSHETKVELRDSCATILASGEVVLARRDFEGHTPIVLTAGRALGILGLYAEWLEAAESGI